MTGRRPRRITLPGTTIPPDNPPLGELPDDELLLLDQAERVELAGFHGSRWARNDRYITRVATSLVEQTRRPDTDREEPTVSTNNPRVADAIAEVIPADDPDLRENMTPDRRAAADQAALRPSVRQTVHASADAAEAENPDDPRSTADILGQISR